MEVIAKFIKDKNTIHGITGEPLSKTKRIHSMYEIIMNKSYEKKWSKLDRLMAADFIKTIINDE